MTQGYKLDNRHYKINDLTGKMAEWRLQKSLYAKFSTAVLRM